ncbi:MAG: helix-turn-helix domain-containing protein [Oscillospiraceae bacterium]|nr:helix-turn-helix domain-containing protein [Oscillospiraceae bacterium]
MIKQYRPEEQAEGLTLHGLAKKSGVNYMKIHQIEKGKIKAEHIMLRTAQSLATALNCDPKDLFTADEPTEKE